MTDSSVPQQRRQEYPAQQRDYFESSEWHACPFRYTEEEIAEINRHYGWEKYRLISKPKDKTK